MKRTLVLQRPLADDTPPASRSDIAAALDAAPLLAAAAARATDQVPIAGPDELVGELREGLFGREFESVEDVVVLDGEQVVGLVSIERLLAAAEDAHIAEVMDPHPLRITPATDQGLAAHELVRRHEVSIPVTDADGRFLGLIPPYRMLSVLLSKHDQDLARLGGYLAGSAQARGAAEESIVRRLLHRLPWLLIGVLGAMGSAVLVGAFESQLEANVLIAFFVPAIVYMAGAIGTQTEIVLVRAFAAGVSARSIVASELITGAIMGAVVGASFFAFATLGWGDERVAFAVSVALFASCSLATGVAIGLPAVLQRLGRDPAFGSGPMATLIQDLLSIAIYLAVVTVVVS